MSELYIFEKYTNSIPYEGKSVEEWAAYSLETAWNLRQVSIAAREAIAAIDEWANSLGDLEEVGNDE